MLNKKLHMLIVNMWLLDYKRGWTDGFCMDSHVSQQLFINITIIIMMVIIKLYYKHHQRHEWSCILNVNQSLKQQ